MAKQKVALLLLATLIAATGLVLLGRPGSNGSSGEVVAAAIPDPDDVREIQATIVEAYKVSYVARVTHDVSGFPSVFVEDPDVPLTREQRDQLRDWLGTVPEGAGYLTYGVAGCHNTERLTRLSEEAWARATAAGRDYITPEDYLTTEELRGIEASGGPIPPPPPSVSQPTMSPEEEAQWKWENTRFESVVISGDRATVTYDDHWFLHEDTLVRREGKWYVAGSERIGTSRW
ncbi:MAG TPA: hypothetical protein VMW79_04200 [Anaerolineae bacterium]|nr:hypothetical protein [Anaerolineae bacterium]